MEVEGFALTMEGFALKKIDAERYAAAAACDGCAWPRQSGGEEESGTRARSTATLADPEENSDLSQALSLFIHPKALLTRVIQVATSYNRFRLVQYKTVGGKVKRCELTMRWPEEMIFVASAIHRVAERRAAALACLKLKWQLLEEEDERSQQRFNQQDKEEEEDLVTDAITGRSYRPLSIQEAEPLSDDLQEEWETAGPGVGAPSRCPPGTCAVSGGVLQGHSGCRGDGAARRHGLVRGVQGVECNILVTQPRRISAVSVAHRVAHEMGPALKRSVGYQLNFSHSLNVSAVTHSPMAPTTPSSSGGVTEEAAGQCLSEGVSHVVVDEVHERNVNKDLLPAMLKDNPNLHVVLMSSTGDNQRLAQYFGGCPLVSVPGFIHPVRDRYLEEVLREMGRPPPLPPRVDPLGRYEVMSLFPLMSVCDQQAVFQRPPEGRMKIVLATNIAETSITIDDIVHVVNAGSQKEQNYDTQTKVDTVWISRSNITQRRGGAGRCQPGHAYHLFPRQCLESMTTFPMHEILHTPLGSLVVQAKIHSPHCKAVNFLSQVLDSPKREAVSDAVRNLQETGVLDKTEALTPLGADALGGSSYRDYLVLSRAVLGWTSVQQEEDRDQTGLLGQFSENLLEAGLVVR
ncbi:unnamed protein product [Coregonus sp. 'balchen']|nr:unnamed protein product [Coregonus sp. 'balchen']